MFDSHKRHALKKRLLRFGNSNISEAFLKLRVMIFSCKHRIQTLFVLLEQNVCTSASIN